MTQKRSELCQMLLDNPKAVYPPITCRSATLEEKQWQELEDMRKKIRTLCEEGKYEEAERMGELALHIVQCGAPAREG